MMPLAVIHQCEKGCLGLFVQKLYFASFVKDLFVLFAQFVFVTDAFVKRFCWAGPSNGSNTATVVQQTISKCCLVLHLDKYVQLTMVA